MPHDHVIADRADDDGDLVPVRPAPGWMGPASAWAGGVGLVTGVAWPVVGKWRRSVGAVADGPWMSGDLWASFPVFVAVVGVLLGMGVLWQVRAHRRPYSAGVVGARLQAWTGIVLGGVAVGLVYGYVIAYAAWRAMTG
ncbi:MAG TPA: hypothetical protein VEA69_16070 [Tepidisphaeraceae bacterium]|nr:hypothetical protein [Tepidisphaeraceae bacterium]